MHRALALIWLIALALPQATRAADIEWTRSIAGQNCTAIASPDRARGARVRLVFSADADGIVTIGLLPRGTAEIVAGDRRAPITSLRLTGTERAGDLPAWDLMAEDEVHVTWRSLDGRYHSARFRRLKAPALVRDLRTACARASEALRAETAEDALRLGPGQRRMINWILMRRAGQTLVPEQAPAIFDAPARDRLAAFSASVAGTARRHLDGALLQLGWTAGGFRIPPSLEAAGHFDAGVAAAKADGRWGILRTDGRWIVRPRFSDAGASIGGFVPVQHGTRWGVIDRTGRLSHQLSHDEIRTCHEGLCPYRSGALWGFLHAAGGIAVPPRFAQVRRFHEALAAVRDDLGWLLIDPTGRPVHRHSRYELFTPSEGRFALIDEAGRWGFAALDGRLVVPPRYDRARAFRDGMAAVRQGRDWGFVDRSGTEAIAPRFAGVGSFQRGLAPARDGSGRWGYIDKAGRWAIAPGFLRAFGFRDGTAIVRAANPARPGKTDPSDLVRGFIDRRGGWLYPPAFEDAYIFKNGLAPVKMLGQWGYLDRALIRR